MYSFISIVCLIEVEYLHQQNMGLSTVLKHTAYEAELYTIGLEVNVNKILIISFMISYRIYFATKLSDICIQI